MKAAAPMPQLANSQCIGEIHDPVLELGEFGVRRKYPTRVRRISATDQRGFGLEMGSFSQALKMCEAVRRSYLGKPGFALRVTGGDFGQTAFSDLQHTTDEHDGRVN